MHATDTRSHEYQEEKVESETRMMRTLFDSMTHLMGASIKKGLDTLRKDNRSFLLERLPTIR